MSKNVLWYCFDNETFYWTLMFVIKGIWWHFVITELAYIVLMGSIQSHVEVIFVGFNQLFFGNDFWEWHILQNRKSPNSLRFESRSLYQCNKRMTWALLIYYWKVHLMAFEAHWKQSANQIVFKRLRSQSLEAYLNNFFGYNLLINLLVRWLPFVIQMHLMFSNAFYIFKIYFYPNILWYIGIEFQWVLF